jgi:amidophosphoribosyltransferase
MVPLMLEEIWHNCGLSLTHSLYDAFVSLDYQQHRGREAAGIAAIGPNRIDAIKWKGTMNTIDIEDLSKIFPPGRYHTYIGHVRYATRGRKDKLLQDAHPHVSGGEVLDRGNHILIRNCDAAIVHNGQVDMKYLSGVDKRLLRTDCDSEALLQYYMANGEDAVLRNVPGSYTAAIADKRKDCTIVLRDRHGIKPGILGVKNGKHIVASEDIAIRKNGGHPIENLEMGSVYYLGSDGSYKKRMVVAPEERQCFFERNYIANADSVMGGVGVSDMRMALGEELAQEFPFDDIDYVTYLPRCPEPAARSYANKIRKEFIYLFYKLKGERAFQGSTSIDRENSINENLHVIPEAAEKVAGKVVTIIDDSMIRGNNADREAALLKQIGVKKAYHINYTPRIGEIGSDGVPRGCDFGVDMPPNDNFIARGRTDGEISQILGMEVHYLSPGGMLRAFNRFGIKGESLCTYCIGGQHPFEKLQVKA